MPQRPRNSNVRAAWIADAARNVRRVGRAGAPGVSRGTTAEGVGSVTTAEGVGSVTTAEGVGGVGGHIGAPHLQT
jgi:hypothetical protein